jgi:hypothetical protein
MGAVEVRIDKYGRTVRQAEQVCSGLFSPGPDCAELQAWVSDEIELGGRVADDLVSTGRCQPGTLDRHFFAVQLRKFPDPDDWEKRRAGLGKACLCQDHSHFVSFGGPGNSVVHRGLPAARPLNGLFWTANITSSPPDSEAAENSAQPHRRYSQPWRLTIRQPG